MIFLSQGPQGKKGMQGLPGNDGPPVSTCMFVLLCEPNFENGA